MKVVLKVALIILLLVAISFLVPAALPLFGLSPPFGMLKFALIIFTLLSSVLSVYLCVKACKKKTPRTFVNNPTTEERASLLGNNDTSKKLELSTYAKTLPQISTQTPDKEEKEVKGSITKGKVKALKKRVAHVRLRDKEENGILGKLVHPEARVELEQLKKDIIQLEKELDERVGENPNDNTKETQKLLKEVRDLINTLNKHISDEISTLLNEIKGYRKIINALIVKHFKKTPLFESWSFFVKPFATYPWSYHLQKERDYEEQSPQKITPEREEIYGKLKEAFEKHNAHINRPENKFLILEKSKADNGQASRNEHEEREAQDIAQAKRDERFRQLGLTAELFEALTPALSGQRSFFS